MTVRASASGYVTADDLALALGALLDDTQHSEHTCHGDMSCPVDAARRTLRAYQSGRPPTFTAASSSDESGTP